MIAKRWLPRAGILHRIHPDGVYADLIIMVCFSAELIRDDLDQKQIYQMVRHIFPKYTDVFRTTMETQSSMLLQKKVCTQETIPWN